MKMRIFHASGSTVLGLLKRQVDAWIKEENPTIVNSSQSVVFGSNGVVDTILLIVFYN